MNETALPSPDRIRDLLAHMGHNLFEKERVVALALLSAIAGESIFLLGPPGVAKSMIARRLKLAFRHARAFEYLMGKFSTPDEVFGPVSISRLKNEDKYERITDHYLPGAQVVFLDEIWKASPPIQNALLTVLNEKIYRNGEQEIQVDIRGLIAASNELPNSGEGLEALWDRFLIRMVVGGIESIHAFEKLLTLPFHRQKQDPVPETLKITTQEYQTWQNAINDVELPGHLVHVIHEIRRGIRRRNATADPDDQWYISDRRWRKTANLLRSSALLNGRQEVALADMLLLIDCLWDSFGQREEMRDLILGSIVASGYERLSKLGTIRTHLDLWREEIEEHTRIVKLRKVIRPKLRYGEDNVSYVEFPGFRGMDASFLRADDWKQLEKGEEKIFPLFELKEGEYKPFQRLGGRKTGDNKIRISGQEFQVLMEEVEEKQVELQKPDPGKTEAWNQQASLLMRQCDERLRQLDEFLQQEEAAMKQHLFIPAEHRNSLDQARTHARRQILDLKLDIEQTRHSYEEMGES